MVFVGEPYRIENHLQVLVGRDRVTRTIFEIENVKRPEVIDNRAVEGSKHRRMNELKPNSSLDHDVGTWMF